MECKTLHWNCAIKSYLLIFYRKNGKQIMSRRISKTAKVLCYLAFRVAQEVETISLSNRAT